jgi:YHS domain-containing protein
MGFMKIRSLFAVLVAAAVAITASLNAEDKKDPLEGIMCPVSGKQVKADATVDYKGAKVYMCCPGCPAGFEKDTAKYAAKANAQLVATGQAKQAKCPISGGATKEGTEVKVASTKVAFCCKNCQGKVAKAEGDDQLNLVFSDEAFGKGFEVKKAEK